jgi:type II secretory pathway pseudopilin PulG
MKKNISEKKGFSLVEAIFAAAILIFVLGVFAAIYMNFTKFYGRQQAQINMGNSAREAAKELQSAALQADQIAVSHNFSGTTYVTDQDTLVLEIPSIDGSGNVVSGEHDYIVFYTNGNGLYRLVEAGAASSRSSGLNEISDLVSAIMFTYNNANLSLANKIDVDIQMQIISRGQTAYYNLHQAIYLRNI